MKGCTLALPMHKSGNLMIAGAPANVISLKQITTIIICTSSRAHKYCGQSQQRGFICIKEHLKDVCGWGCWAESLLLRDESSTCWPSRCLAMHIKTGDGINIFPNDLAKWKTITVMIPPRKALMFSYTKRARNGKRNGNTCIEIKVKLLLFLFLNEHHTGVTSLVSWYLLDQHDKWSHWPSLFSVGYPGDVALSPARFRLWVRNVGWSYFSNSRTWCRHTSWVRSQTAAVAYALARIPLAGLLREWHWTGTHTHDICINWLHTLNEDISCCWSGCKQHLHVTWCFYIAIALTSTSDCSLIIGTYYNDPSFCSFFSATINKQFMFTWQPFISMSTTVWDTK